MPGTSGYALFVREEARPRLQGEHPDKPISLENAFNLGERLWQELSPIEQEEWKNRAKASRGENSGEGRQLHRRVQKKMHEFRRDQLGQITADSAHMPMPRAPRHMSSTVFVTRASELIGLHTRGNASTMSSRRSIDRDDLSIVLGWEGVNGGGVKGVLEHCHAKNVTILLSTDNEMCVFRVSLGLLLPTVDKSKCVPDKLTNVRLGEGNGGERVSRALHRALSNTISMAGSRVLFTPVSTYNSTVDMLKELVVNMENVRLVSVEDLLLTLLVTANPQRETSGKLMSGLLGVEMRLPSGDKEEAISTNVDDEGVRAAMAWRTKTPGPLMPSLPRRVKNILSIVNPADVGQYPEQQSVDDTVVSEGAVV